MVSYLSGKGGLWGMSEWLVGWLLGLLGGLFKWMNGGIVWIFQTIINWFGNGFEYYRWFWSGQYLHQLSDAIGWFALHNLWPNIQDAGPVQGLLTAAVVVLIFFFWAFFNLLVMMWMELKVVARFWDMRGPIHMGPLKLGFMVTMAYAMKLMVKEIITPKKADKWVYTVAPALFVSSSMLLFCGIPLSEDFYVADLGLGVVFLFAVFGIAPLAVIGGGWASNNKYTLIGGMRSTAMLMSYEIPMLLSLVPVFMVTGTFSPLEIAAWQLDNNIALGVPFFLSFLVLLICIVAETERIPFDLPEAESELVEGWTTEYGGMRFGFIMFSEYIRSFVGAGIVAILFFGGWNTPILNYFAGVELPLPSMLIMLGKIYLIFFGFIWLRASLPRVRTDQILNFGWKKLLPLTLISIFIAVGLKSLGVL